MTNAVANKVPCPCSYCKTVTFKGWKYGKCPYCGNVKQESKKK